MLNLFEGHHITVLFLMLLPVLNCPRCYLYVPVRALLRIVQDQFARTIRSVAMVGQNCGRFVGSRLERALGGVIVVGDERELVDFG